jgi:hypothetical protein
MRSSPGEVNLRQFETHGNEAEPLLAKDAHARLDDELNPRSNVIYHDFSEVKKPTELEITPAGEVSEVPKTAEGEPLRSAVDIAMEKTEKHVEAKASPEAEKYRIPQAFMEYIDDLIRIDRKLRSLKFDYDIIDSKEKLKRKLARYRATDAGDLSEEEYEKALSLIDGEAYEHIPTSAEVAMKKTDTYAEHPAETPDAAPEVPAVQHAPEAAPLAAEKIDESLERDLSDAREAYISQLKAWKAKNQQNKSWVRKNILGNLGIDRQMPLVSEPEELVEARTAYETAKKRYAESLFKDDPADFLREGDSAVLPEALLAVRESEDAVFEKELAGALSGGMSAWAKASEYMRHAVAEKLLSADMPGFGSLAAAEAPYSGFRQHQAPEAMPEASSAGNAPKRVDGIFKKKHAASEEHLSESVGTVDMEHIEERERDFLAHVEEESDPRKAELLKKAGALMGGAAESASGENDPSEGAASGIDEAVSEEMPPEDEAQPVKEPAGEADIRPEGEGDAVAKLEGAAEQPVLPVLPDAFQDGTQFSKERVAFSLQFQAELDKLQLGIKPIPIPFEMGSIHIVRGLEGDPNEVTVFLNGKTIAEGPVGKVAFDKSLKGSWFMDNAYQRAFKSKELQKELKKLKAV